MKGSEDEFVREQREIWNQIQGNKSNKGTNLEGDQEAEENCLEEYLTDSTLLEEQRRIMERFEREQKQQRQQQQQPQRRRTQETRQPRVSDTATAQPRHLATLLSAPRRDSGGADVRYRTKEELATPSSSAELLLNDTVTKVGKQRVRIKGTRHVYESISNGTATLVRCVSCHGVFQVSATAKRLYCTHCHEISPILPVGTAAMMTPAAASATAATPTATAAPLAGAGGCGNEQRLDHQIARVVQQQEDDVALARKLAFFSNTSGGGPKRSR